MGDTIRPRLDKVEADPRHVFAVDGTLTLDEHGIAYLDHHMRKVEPSLVIIDPIVAYMGADLDMYRANETRAFLDPLGRLAEEFGAAILIVRHLTKSNKDRAIYRGIGSIDFAAKCRSMLLAGCDPENREIRAVVQTKNNLAQEGPSFGYELTSSGFLWTGKTMLTALDILKPEGRKTLPIQEARELLIAELAAEDQAASALIDKAKALGISKRTLERAKQDLSVASHRVGIPGKKGGGRSMWSLPKNQ